MTVNTISPSKLSEICRSGQPIELIDVRTPAEYREVHVTAARNVPLDELDPAAVIKGRKASANEPLYLICKMGGRSAMACEMFIQAGFTNVVNVEGGTDACVDAGEAVVRGENIISRKRHARIVSGSRSF